MSTPVPPFRLLDPALAIAEKLLVQGPLADVVAVLPDERTATARLNAVLAGAGPIHLLNGRRLDFAVHSALSTGAYGIALLVVVDGWRRLKLCEVCGEAFVDRTNGCSRRRCGRHRVRCRRR